MTSRSAHLRAVLGDHEAADLEEERHLADLLDVLTTCAAPFARDQYEPGHFTASAFVLDPESQAVLLIYHRKLKRWLQPGGHVEHDDVDLLAAARREVAEETGLTDVRVRLSGGPLDVDVHRIPERPTEPSHFHYDVRFLFQACSRRVCAASDAEEAQWVRLDALDSVETDASVRRAVRKIRDTLQSEVRD